MRCGRMHVQRPQRMRSQFQAGVCRQRRDLRLLCLRAFIERQPAREQHLTRLASTTGGEAG